MSAIVNFEVGRLKKKNKMMKNGGLYPCIFHTLRVLYGRETLIELVMCLKRLITVVFRSSDPFHLVNGHVCVCAIPT